MAASSGMVLCILARVADISFEGAMKAHAPFFIPLLVKLAIVTYWPDMVLCCRGSSTFDRQRVDTMDGAP